MMKLIFRTKWIFDAVFVKKTDEIGAGMLLDGREMRRVFIKIVLKQMVVFLTRTGRCNKNRHFLSSVLLRHVQGRTKAVRPNR